MCVSIILYNMDFNDEYILLCGPLITPREHTLLYNCVSQQKALFLAFLSLSKSSFSFILRFCLLISCSSLETLFSFSLLEGRTVVPLIQRGMFQWENQQLHHVICSYIIRMLCAFYLLILYTWQYFAKVRLFGWNLQVIQL